MIRSIAQNLSNSKPKLSKNNLKLYDQIISEFADLFSQKNRRIQVNAVISIKVFMYQFNVQLSKKSLEKIFEKSKEQIRAEDKNLAQDVIMLIYQIICSQKQAGGLLDDIITKCYDLLVSPSLSDKLISQISKLFVKICFIGKMSEDTVSDKIIEMISEKDNSQELISGGAKVIAALVVKSSNNKSLTKKYIKQF